MVKLFITDPIDDSHTSLLFWEHFGIKPKSDSLFFDGESLNYSNFGFESVNNVSEADYVAVSSNIFSREGKICKYLNHWLNFAKDNEKPTIFFSLGDLSHDIHIPEASVVFKNSTYRFSFSKNEKVLPAFVEDLGANYGIDFLSKSEKPTVGFCGWADFSSNILRFKSGIKNFSLEALAFVKRDSSLLSLKKGIFFRKKAIKNIIKSIGVQPNFIIRKSFSAHSKTIELSPEKARKEFVQNIKESHFSLAIKGDGNFSNRFYEILSLGRVPVLIDTECVMPLEGELDYSEFCLRVDFRQIDRLGEIIKNFYDSLSEEKFIGMQKRAREVFETRFKADVFYRNFLSSLKK